MLLLERQAFARAALVGNPSDGYHGKTISLIVRNFHAKVVLYEWEDVELVWTDQYQHRFPSIDALIDDVKTHGYFGGIPLIKATIKKFYDYCQAQGIALHGRNFSMRYESNIPRQVGLAGSSAIIIAALRCLMDFYGVRIAKEVQAALALAVETEELGIAAGLQDRVIQVYQGLVYMDFAQDRMRRLSGYGCGVYEPLDPALLPPLYLAYSSHDAPDMVQPTQAVHTPLRVRFLQGEPKVLEAMQTFADLTEQGRQALLASDHERLGQIINKNFDVRRSILENMLPGQIKMVETARSAGASAHFAGSGGAILGTYPDQPTYQRLVEAMKAIGCRVLRPRVH